MVMHCANLKIQSRNAELKILTSVYTVHYVLGTPRDDKIPATVCPAFAYARTSKYKTDSEIYCMNYRSQTVAGSNLTEMIKENHINPRIEMIFTPQYRKNRTQVIVIFFIDREVILTFFYLTNVIKKLSIFCTFLNSTR